MKSYDISQISQRQLRVGEMVKQALSLIFIRGEAKIPTLETNLITVTEVRMTPDLKIAKVFVLPLAGKEKKKTIDLLKEFSYIVRKALSKKIEMKYLPRISFIEDQSFEYAEKIEKLIKQTNG